MKLRSLVFRVIFASSALLFLAQCGAIESFPNVALSDFDKTCPDRYPDWNASGNTVVALSISGGGKRAAAYAYGVLSELQQIPVAPPGGPTLLHEIDLISGVSGGSVIAAFLKLKRDLTEQPIDLLNGFDKFLYDNTEASLLRRLSNPLNWWHLAATSYSRTDLLADYFDERLYSQSTLGKLKPWPYLTVMATDLLTGHRFNFNETQLNCIGSDYERFRLAHAVAASSAYPVYFPTLTLKNFNYPQPEGIYPERKKGNYLPLSDGGLIDNYATRVYLDLLGYGRLIGSPDGDPRRLAKTFVFIRIDASRIAADLSPRPPYLLSRLERAFDVASEQQIKDSDDLFTREIGRLWKEWRLSCGNRPPFRYKYINARLRHASPALQKIETRWTLSDEEIKSLIEEGEKTIRDQNEEIREFLELYKSGDEKDVVCRRSEKTSDRDKARSGFATRH